MKLSLEEAIITIKFKNGNSITRDKIITIDEEYIPYGVNSNFIQIESEEYNVMTNKHFLAHYVIDKRYIDRIEVKLV